MKKVRLLGCTTLLILLALGAGTFWSRLQTGISPAAEGEERYVRYDRNDSLRAVLADLESRGIIRDARQFHLWSRITRKPQFVRAATYTLRPGMTAEEVLAALDKPVRQMVRLRETNWARRNAAILEKNGVTTVDEYMELVERPDEFRDVVAFPLPEKSLEGYLYPDTYELPPLLGARETIVRQLRNFEKRVWNGLGKPEDLHRHVIVASMVELEVAKDEERPMVAGVIENRLRIGMPLQIDATILYGIQEWRPLTFRDYREARSDFSTYHIRGLPPGPICSPTVRSIEAAMAPEEHEFLYYVALPEGRHLFSRDYATHQRNIQTRRAAIRALERG
jgi:UPF0755 protein